jgi:sialic acid synthase SpsE
MSMMEINIGGRLIGKNHPCYLIAEVGTTCMGDLCKALKLIKAAKDAGVDAIKFQVIDPSQLSDESVNYPVKIGEITTQVSMKDMFQKLVFDEATWAKIYKEAKSEGLDFFATVDYIEGVEMLDRIGVDAHKIGAWDSTYKQLIEAIGKTGKPMYADLGPTSEVEAHDIVDWYKKSGGETVLFMHDFHTIDDRQMNLRAINKLNELFPWPAGFSSPAQDTDLDIAALALGAAYIEKRLILDRTDFAFHAHESLEPAELKAWVQRVRHVESALGRAVIEPSTADLEGSKKYYRSLCSVSDIRAGEVFTVENLGAKRPGIGMPTSMQNAVLGKKAVRDISINTLITPKDFS